MRKAHQVLAGIAAAALAGSLAATVAASPAAASPGDCVGGVNGFRDIPDSSDDADRGVLQIGGMRVSLEVGERGVGGGQVGYVRALNTDGRYYRYWMDVTNRLDRRDWIQCGPFDLYANENFETTPAYRTSSSPNRAFRACGDQWDGDAGRFVGFKCTHWW